MRQSARIAAATRAGIFAVAVLGAVQARADECGDARTDVNGTMGEVNAELRAQWYAKKISTPQYNEKRGMQRKLHQQAWNSLKPPADCTLLARDYCAAVAQDYDVTCAY